MINSFYFLSFAELFSGNCFKTEKQCIFPWVLWFMNLLLWFNWHFIWVFPCRRRFLDWVHSFFSWLIFIGWLPDISFSLGWLLHWFSGGSSCRQTDISFHFNYRFTFIVFIVVKDCSWHLQTFSWYPFLIWTYSKW